MLKNITCNTQRDKADNAELSEYEKKIKEILLNPKELE